jgi:hypothetical protein
VRRRHGTVTLREHLEALRAADDRRYTETTALQEKALLIKERADEVALSLAREIQTYKDTKANELREQIASERGLYVTKEQLDALAGRQSADIAALREYFDALHRPVVEFMATYRGGAQKRSEGRLDIGAIVQALAFLAALGAVLVIAFKK